MNKRHFPANPNTTFDPAHFSNDREVHPDHCTNHQQQDGSPFDMAMRQYETAAIKLGAGQDNVLEVDAAADRVFALYNAKPPSVPKTQLEHCAAHRRHVWGCRPCEEAAGKFNETAEAQPVAWDVVAADGTLVAGRVSKQDAEEIASRWEHEGSRIAPLYRSPPPSAPVGSGHTHPHEKRANCHCIRCRPLERPCDCDGCRALTTRLVSAPAGVDGLKARARELLQAEYDRDYFAGNYEDAAIDAIIVALAQQPAPAGVPVDVVREYLDARACYDDAHRKPNSHAPAPTPKHGDPVVIRLRQARIALDAALAQQPTTSHTCRNCSGIDPDSCMFNQQPAAMDGKWNELKIVVEEYFDDPHADAEYVLRKIAALAAQQQGGKP